jgi:hypothetical protein
VNAAATIVHKTQEPIHRLKRVVTLGAKLCARNGQHNDRKRPPCCSARMC